MSRFGWVPDLPDKRDQLFLDPRPDTLPVIVDLTSGCPPVYDQGQLGSCTAQAIAGALEFDQAKQGALPTFTPSRLFIYYNERVIENSVDSDAGAMIRDGAKSVARQGAPPEPMWPYDPMLFANKPVPEAYAAAKLHRVISYRRLSQLLTPMKTCLAAGFPFVFGFTVYESFESDAVAITGNVPMPDLSVESVLGGHAVLAVGYNDDVSRFLVRNSWGAGWGNGGYFTIPYEYLLDVDLAADFWTIRAVR